MNSGLHRIGLTGLAGLLRLARRGGGSPAEPEPAAGRSSRPGSVWLPAALVIGLGAWMLLSGYSSKTAEGEPAQLGVAAAPEPAPSSAADSVQGAPVLNSATAPVAVAAPAEIPAVDALKISSQSWRRGGLGSKALVTFTLRNGNDYAVKDIEISCAFTRRDGSHLTDRRRMIHETVNTKSRKTFARMHVGFVNVNADRAKCTPVTASR
jgi:hypothetical protein